MDEQQQSRWQPTRKQLLWAGGTAALAFLIIVICGYLFEWKWTGLPKRTLWDWMQLLIIPAVLAGGGLWFSRQQREQELHLAAEQRKQDLEAADRRAQDEALQAYLDQMSDMLIPSSKDLPSLYRARPGDSLSSVARARTLTVLPRLDGVRKARVVQFLYESGLISSERPVLDLSKADLSGAVLFDANLSGANLSGANLIRANLNDAVLNEANLFDANLYEASLRRASLSGANLSGASLRGVSLSGAKLWKANLIVASLNEANLSEANLSGAVLWKANLSSAKLEGAKGVTDDQLALASFRQGATMPDGQILKGDDNPDGLTFEEWLKSKGRGEDGGDRGP